MNTPFIIAEIGGNHRGNPEWARRLVQVAHDAGADAVKFQAFTPEQMAADDKVIESGPWAGRNAVDLYREIWTPRPWFGPLFDRARRLGMIPLSSVFHPDDVDFLETLHCPIYKISSFELTDFPLIAHAASKRCSLIISTGMGSLEEIGDAILAARQNQWHPDITLLKCTSAYPAPIEEMNLATLRDMARRFGVDVGMSDHTIGHTAAVVATVLGASVIEKHLILDRSHGGPDAAFSAEPAEFAAMVKACREAAAALGEVRYGPTPAEASSALLRRQPHGKRGE